MEQGQGLRHRHREAQRGALREGQGQGQWWVHVGAVVGALRGAEPREGQGAAAGMDIILAPLGRSGSGGGLHFFVTGHEKYKEP